MRSLVAHGAVGHGAFEHPIEHHPAAAGAAAVKAERELVQVTGHVRVAHRALVGAQQPPFGQRGDPVHRGKEFAGVVPARPGGPLAAPVVDVAELLQPAVACPAVDDDRVPTHGPVDLVVDSTGLSVFGEGEWAAAKHGGRGKRGWKKLHLGVDRSGVIVAQALTAPTSDDATTGVRFVETVPGDVASVTADTAYDTVAFYAAASARDARVVVPPARTASLSRHGPRSRARDRTIRRVQILGWRRWKKASRYPRQAREENVVFSVQVDQRTWSASPHGSRATDRGAPRVRRAESDDRTRSARVLPHRSVRARRSGRLRLNDQSCNNAEARCHAYLALPRVGLNTVFDGGLDEWLQQDGGTGTRRASPSASLANRSRSLNRTRSISR